VRRFLFIRLEKKEEKIKKIFESSRKSKKQEAIKKNSS